jgi:surface antigen
VSTPGGPLRCAYHRLAKVYGLGLYLCLHLIFAQVRRIWRQEYPISNPTTKAAHLQIPAKVSSKLLSRLRGRVSKFMHQRKVIRYGLLGLNAMVLVGVAFFVLQSSSDSSSQSSLSNSPASGVSSDPLDQLSSADIALTSARMIGLAEESGVKSQAESVNTELAVPPVYSSVIAKPQTVSTDLKSRKDIKEYVAVPGDTVGSIATKFNITSDSIKWSNNLSTDAVNAGTKLTIPPVNGIVYSVKSGDTPDTLATKFKANKEQIIAYNDAEINGLKIGENIIIPNGQQPVAPRAASYAYSGFSWGSSAVYGYNGYDYGFCTWYVANRRAEIGRPVPANLGNAATWDDRATFAGMNVSKSPSYGAAVVTSQRGAGHVAFVERVDADGIWVSEMNSRGQRSITDTTSAGGWNRTDFKFIPMSTAVTYNYIH